MPLTFSLMEISGSLFYKGLLKSTKSKKSFLFFCFFQRQTACEPV